MVLYQELEWKGQLYRKLDLAYGATWASGIIAGNVDPAGRGGAALSVFSNTTTAIYVWFSASTPGVLAVIRNGRTAAAEKLAGGVNICTVSGAVYFAKIPVASGDTIDFTYSGTSGTIYNIDVREVGNQ
jgi:hypothetical protein